MRELVNDVKSRGREREDLLPGLRSFPVGRYVITYSVEPNGERLIVRVIPGDRDIPSVIRRRYILRAASCAMFNPVAGMKLRRSRNRGGGTVQAEPGQGEVPLRGPLQM